MICTRRNVVTLGWALAGSFLYLACFLPFYFSPGSPIAGTALESVLALGAVAATLVLVACECFSIIHAVACYEASTSTRVLWVLSFVLAALIAVPLYWVLVARPQIESQAGSGRSA